MGYGTPETTDFGTDVPRRPLLLSLNRFDQRMSRLSYGNLTPTRKLRPSSRSVLNMVYIVLTFRVVQSTINQLEAAGTGTIVPRKVEVI